MLLRPARFAHQITRKRMARQTPAPAALLYAVSQRDKLPVMRRFVAIVALASLLCSPAALGAAAGCCQQPSCCQQGLCPMHRASHSPQPAAGINKKDREVKEDQPMRCHAAKKEQKQSAPGCMARASCNHSAQVSLLAPVPRAVMTAPASLETPVARRASPRAISIRLTPGFTAPPFNPPRTLA